LGNTLFFVYKVLIQIKNEEQTGVFIDNSFILTTRRKNYMAKKMTSGEIAKKTGVSQKAIRLYDEKGLLKPSDYTEGNYRLYDKEALLVLEKIIALKEVGFSLEEIKDNLSKENDMSVYQVLEKQVKVMEERKYKLEKAIACIRNAMERCKEEPDWDSIADIMRNIQIDQKADEGHFDALKYSADTEDWYVKIFRSLSLKQDEKVLDLGCGFGKLWRNNLSDIPQGVKVSACDVHGSWADNLAEFVEENKGNMPPETDISFKWGDLEDEASWDVLKEQAPYDRVIAFYLFGFLKNKELLVKRAADVLSENGVFCCTGVGVSSEYIMWKDIFTEICIDTKFVDTKVAEMKQKTDKLDEMLSKYFTKIEKVELSSSRSYKTADEAFERVEHLFEDSRKSLALFESKIKAHLERIIEEKGEILVVGTSEFCKCTK